MCKVNPPGSLKKEPYDDEVVVAESSPCLYKKNGLPTHALLIDHKGTRGKVIRNLNIHRSQGVRGAR
jgi:hypothetical protein